ncbi:MAG: S8 family serine peptidase [Pseudomonadota bacterium]|nr:S8 family serine peptidase [Pseudomonadota bacterium]
MNTRHFSGMKALALATSLALGTLATTSVSAGQVYTDDLNTQQSFGQFIVQFKAQTAARGSTAGAVSAVASLALQTGRPLAHARRLGVGADLIRVEGKQLTSAEANRFMHSIASNPDVEYVQADAMMHALFVPNDTRYGEQWHYVGGASGMNLPAAWDIATGSGVVVAVIDTGITSHSDLAANLVAGYDFISDSAAARDGNGRDSNPQDEGDWFTGAECGVSFNQNSSWHGSHVAGTIAAVTNNSAGVAGVAFNARVQPVRVLGKCGGTLSDIADAIVWASGGTVSGIPANPTPAKVINMSLGGSGACDATYQNAINSAVGRGTVVAVAAGNSNANASGFRPASCNNVINVASLDREGNRASYSNYGTIIDIAAPGGETAVSGNGVLSTLNTGTTTPGSATYAFYQGTSMAAPHIAGLAAVMLSKTPSLSPAQVESTMRANVRALTGTCSGGCGAGVADAGKTLQALNGTPTNVAPTANFSFTTSALTATFTDSSSDSDGTIASRSWNFGDGTTSTATSPSKSYGAAGTYTVTLTVTDNGGATNAKSSSVTVTSGGGGTVLSNGVAVTGLSAALGASLNYTMVVPAGATGLKFVMAGGSGDADMYVKFGSAPTDTVYDCRPYLGGNAETCNIATAQAGTYHVRLKAYSAFSGVSLTGSYTAGGGGTSFFQNTADYAIGDNTTVNSPIVVSGRTGNAPSTLSVAVNIVHTYQGDLKVDLVAPDGTLYNIHNYTGGGIDNIIKTVTINASSEVANGTWNLRVNDNAAGDVGYINSWSMQF